MTTKLTAAQALHGRDVLRQHAIKLVKAGYRHGDGTARFSLRRQIVEWKAWRALAARLMDEVA